MNLVLITKTAIVEKIFTLICKKLDIDLTVTQSTSFEDNVDFIIVDEEFINDDFNKFRANTKRLAAIVSKELPFEKTKDFTIQRPFLPAYLESLLKEQIQILNNLQLKENKNIQEPEINNQEFKSIDSEIKEEHIIINDDDESIVTISSLNNGGVLDNSELVKISTILEENKNEINYDNEVSEVNEKDLNDISEIIDNALKDIEDYKFDLDEDINEPNKLILNNYNILELKPFLQKLDQKLIDKLANGDDVNLILSLKVKD